MKQRKLENINLIRRIAWSFHETTGLEWNELFQEAALAYLEAESTHDIDRGKLSTHVWNCITSRLCTYLRQEKEWRNPLCDLDEATELYNTYDLFWKRIPLNIQNQVNIIMEHADRLDICFLNDTQASKERREMERASAKITIRSLLRQAGYTTDVIKGTLQELELVAQTF